MARTIEQETKLDIKKVDEISLDKKFAQAAILEGQVVSIGTTSGTVIPCTNATIPYGVACNGVTAIQIGEYQSELKGTDSIEVVVALEGRTRVLGGEPLAINTWVSVDANGRVVEGTPAMQELIGFTVTPCAGDGHQCSIFIHRIPAGTRAPQ
jgi:hypothetical protein